MAKRRAIADVLGPDTEPAAEQPPAEQPPAAPRPARARKPSAARPQRESRSSTPRRAPQPQPDRTVEHDRRLNVPVSDAELRSLGEARLNDGIPAAARVRAMIALWQENEDVRRRVDSRAHRGR